MSYIYGFNKAPHRKIKQLVDMIRNSNGQVFSVTQVALSLLGWVSVRYKPGRGAYGKNYIS